MSLNFFDLMGLDRTEKINKIGAEMVADYYRGIDINDTEYQDSLFEKYSIGTMDHIEKRMLVQYVETRI